MPFDTTSGSGEATFPLDYISPSGVHLGKIERLVSLLRGDLPANFHWNFRIVHRRTECGTAGCALGVAYEAGLLRNTSSALPFGFLPGVTIETTAHQLGLSLQQVQAIFYGEFNTYADFYWDEITPEMVADKLEALLQSEPAPQAEGSPQLQSEGEG